VVRRRGDLSRPRGGLGLSTHYDPEAFGRFSETIARFLGTGRFLVVQTVLVLTWIAVNLSLPYLRWDKYPFILLNLVFSTQAAYAAPLILLAQNRQDDRDRRVNEHDRQVNNRTQADTEFVARELAAVRISLADVATSDDLRGAVDRMATTLERVESRLDQIEAARGRSAGS